MSGFVAMHLHASCPALGDIYDDDTSFNGLFQHMEEPILARGITATEGFHDDSFQPGDIQDALHHLRRDAGEEFQDSDVAIQ